MTLSDKSLRELLSSPRCDEVANRLLDSVKRGSEVLILTADGTSIKPVCEAHALDILRRHGWKGRPHGHTDEPLQFVLGLCKKFDGVFTIKDILSRISVSRPALLGEFPSIWEKLLALEYVRVRSSTAPYAYAVLNGEMR